MASGDASYSPIPNRPLTALELKRIGVALQALASKSSHQVWIVMCGDPPEVVAAADSREAAAKRARDAARDRKEPCDVYGPFDTASTYSYANALLLSVHDRMTECHGLAPLSAFDPKNIPTLDDVVSTRLSISWRHGDGPTTVVEYDVPVGTDAIFFTRAAREGFVYPRYHTVFGPDYEEAIRRRFQEPR
jgi:hypothetical protein